MRVIGAKVSAVRRRRSGAGQLWASMGPPGPSHGKPGAEVIPEGDAKLGAGLVDRARPVRGSPYRGRIARPKRAVLTLRRGEGWACASALTPPDGAERTC